MHGRKTEGDSAEITTPYRLIGLILLWLFILLWLAPLASFAAANFEKTAVENPAAVTSLPLFRSTAR
jgi:hypothetical protein